MTTFVDTNVLVYAYDETDAAKSTIAKKLVADLWRTRDGVISTQVLQELYVTLTRKVRRPLSKAKGRTIVGRHTRWQVHALSAGDVVEAMDLEQRHSLSFWDALIIVAAARSGAERLLTEDLQHGRTIAGVRIVDPFR